jgi:hypothetical protein
MRSRSGGTPVRGLRKFGACSVLSIRHFGWTVYNRRGCKLDGAGTLEHQWLEHLEKRRGSPGIERLVWGTTSCHSSLKVLIGRGLG